MSLHPADVWIQLLIITADHSTVSLQHLVLHTRHKNSLLTCSSVTLAVSTWAKMQEESLNAGISQLYIPLASKLKLKQCSRRKKCRKENSINAVCAPEQSFTDKCVSLHFPLPFLLPTSPSVSYLRLSRRGFLLRNHCAGRWKSETKVAEAET